MDDKLPVILEEDEELLDIEPVELELKGKDSDENIKWKGHPHVASRFGTILLSILLVIFGLVVTPIGIITYGDTVLFFAGPIMFLVGLTSLMFVYIHIKFTRYVITDSALYKQTGIITNDVTKIPIDKLHSLTYKQSIAEKLLNFGTVGMSTGGQEVIEIEFISIKNPSEIHNKIDNLIEERIERGRTVVLDDQSKQIEILEEKIKELENQID